MLGVGVGASVGVGVGIGVGGVDGVGVGVGVGVRVGVGSGVGIAIPALGRQHTEVHVARRPRGALVTVDGTSGKAGQRCRLWRRKRKPGENK